MNYIKINYHALKDYIEGQKGKFDLTDILILLELGFINQQQYEDLCTVVSKPMYLMNNFYYEDKGYYRQQGPLTNVQVCNDIKAGKNMNRLLKKIAKEVTASSDEINKIVEALKNSDKDAKKVFREFARTFDTKLMEFAEDESNYEDGRYSPDMADITEEIFANDPDFISLTTFVADMFEGEKDIDEVIDLLDEAYQSKDLQDVLSENGERVWMDMFNDGKSEITFKMTDIGPKQL